MKEREDLEREILQMDHDYVLGVGLEKMPIVFESGKGVVIRDIRGREYLDFMAQTLNVAVGHGHPDVIEAAIQQMRKLSFCTMLAANEPKARLAKLIADICPKPLKMFYTISGGSEANESATKLAKRARHKNGGFKIISRLGAYHGATAAANAATGLIMAKPPFIYPTVPGFIHVPMPYCYRCSFGQTYPSCKIECAKIIEEYIIQEGPDIFAAVIMEPIVSAKGVIVPVDEYLKIVRDICSKYGIILIFDEIVDGFGRTGRMFGCEHYDVSPDIMTLGKGVTSGYAALSGMVVTEELGKLGFEPYYHGFTFSGSPLANAVALANIQVIQNEKLVENSARMGDYFLKGLKDLQEDFVIIGDVRGRGLLISLELVKDRKSKEANFEDGREITNICMQNGLLLHYQARGDTCNLLFTPPLCVESHHIDQALNTLRKAFQQVRPRQ